MKSTRCWFVAQHWRIPLPHGNLLPRFEELNNKTILSLPTKLIEHLFLIISSNSWIFCLFLSPLVPLYPLVSLRRKLLYSLILPHYHSCISVWPCAKRNSRRRSLLMLVLAHSGTHCYNRYMVGCGCHERSDQSHSSQGYMAWCGCHEILTRRSLSILFWSNLFVLSVPLCEGLLGLFLNPRP